MVIKLSCPNPHPERLELEVLVHIVTLKVVITWHFAVTHVFFRKISFQFLSDIKAGSKLLELSLIHKTNKLHVLGIYIYMFSLIPCAYHLSLRSSFNVIKSTLLTANCMAIMQDVNSFINLIQHLCMIIFGFLPLHVKVIHLQYGPLDKSVCQLSYVPGLLMCFLRPACDK